MKNMKQVEDIFKPNISIKDLLACVKSYGSPENCETVRAAYVFAEKAHKGQTRKSGESYIFHPLAAAYFLAKMRMDPNIVVATLLHDVPEDTNVSLDEIEKKFGPDITSLVRGVTKLGKLKYRGVERYIENLRKMFVAMAEDIRVMIIKFADRIHNLYTLDSLPNKKRGRIALESMEIYAPIANRLGMDEIKGLLEDLSFYHLHQKEYEKVDKIRDEYLSGRGAYLEKVMDILKKELKTNGIDCIDIHGRRKQLYSLYQKLVRKQWEIDKVYDVIAVRVILKEIGDCYAALGVIHQLWHPCKGRIKDYIAQPKPNGYKSIHTTVFCLDGKIVEFQIRTMEMHDEDEYGVAAHWHYDEMGVRLPPKEVSWVKELAEIQKEILGKMSDLNDMKIDFFKNHIFVFTPQGDVIDLPDEATPVDFAYQIHSDLGDKCSGARVNDHMVSLDTPLKNGDMVEIIVEKNRKKPNPDWLKTVKTRLAREHIKNRINNEKIRR